MLFRAFELRCEPRARTLPPLSLGQRLKAAAAWLCGWIESCADHYAAAKIYETLFRLSDAELARRGLSRENLMQDVVCRCERSSQPARRPEVQQ